MSQTRDNMYLVCYYLGMLQLEYTEEIIKAGLSTEQAIVYEVLLKVGEAPASTIAKSIPAGTSLSRPLVYKVLDELIELELAIKSTDTSKVARFLPKHPVAISQVIDKQKEQIDPRRYSGCMDAYHRHPPFQYLHPGLRILGNLSSPDRDHRTVSFFLQHHALPVCGLLH